MSIWSKLQNPRCDKCSLAEAARRVCSVSASGPHRTHVLFVGEAPGEEEERKGIPFVGRAGKYLMDILEEADWSHSYTISNAVWCRPPENATPTMTQIRTCSTHYLYRVIEQVAPKLIICLGASAIRAITHENWGVKGTRLKVFEYGPYTYLHNKKPRREKQRTAKVVCTYHPAAALRAPSLRSVILQDLEFAEKVLVGDTVEEKPEDLRYSLDGGPTRYRRGRSMAIDLETNCWSPWEKNSEILCAATSQAPLAADSITFDPTRKPTKDLAVALADKKIMKVGHNVKFDLMWLKAKGFKVRGPVFDTMVAFHLISEEYPDKSLEHLAARYTPMGMYARGMKEKRGTITEVSEELLEYCAKDADATLRLKKLFAYQIKRQHLSGVMRLEMRTLRTLVDVEHAGMKVDTNEMDILSTLYKKKRAKIRQRIRREFPTLNLQSTPQLCEVLYNKMGLPVLRRTPKKAPSTRADVLEKLKERTDGKAHQFVSDVLAMREYAKIENGFLTPIREEHLRWDGCVHPTFQLATVVTGRLSCSDPNLQNVPESVRSVFVSRFEEGSLVNIDYSQIELRVLADISREKKMLDVFLAGGDIHSSTAGKLFGVDVDRVTEKQRHVAKTINFGILYGMLPRRLASETGMSYHESEMFLAEFWTQYPRVRRWVRKIRRQCVVRGVVRDPCFGRLRRIPIDDPESKEGQHALRQGPNFVIQWIAAALTKVSMNTLHGLLRGMRSKIVATVHDSIVLDVPDSELEEVLMMADEVCQRPNTLPWGFEMEVPLVVEIKYGPNWKDMKAV